MDHIDDGVRLFLLTFLQVEPSSSHSDDMGAGDLLTFALAR